MCGAVPLRNLFKLEGATRAVQHRRTTLFTAVLLALMPQRTTSQCRVSQSTSPVRRTVAYRIL
jgi:hypothetical protein